MFRFRGFVMKACRFLFLLFFFAASVVELKSAFAETVNIAVAANFTDPAKEMAQIFKEKTGHDAILSFGPSVQLYTQIKESAPFQIFLSADGELPKKLIEEGSAVPDSSFTYAIGRLVLWSKKSGFVKNEDVLKKGNFTKLSIANPASAPYGVAAVEVMKALNVYDALQSKIVQGNSIAQAFQFVDSENAELGFIAQSQIMTRADGSGWQVPQKLYKEMRQDAVLLKSGENNEAAKAFITFLKGSVAKNIIKKFGYAIAGKP
jgi:molybdate transport system substrate-binding protein